ncbi:MAG: FHA domain-containing protein [Eubacteriales bacterium]|nr:FHA domain-containing protein [Eubacteriales bacterium]
MSFIKPVLIAVLVVLTVLIIIKANRFATSGPSEQTGSQPKPRPKRQSPANIDFYIVYVGRRIPVTHYPFTIGSRSDNDLVITDSTVSRKHAELFLKNGHVCLRDLGSLNGTLVNRVSRSEATIVGGEKVQFGKTIVQIERAYGDEVSDETQFIRR